MPADGTTRARPSGRRPGDSGTREAIRVAARRQFAERGYDRTSMRSIAREAGVDPTLITHFHGSKEELFVSVVNLPFDPVEVLPQLLAGPKSQLGERLSAFLLGVLESEEGRGVLIGRIRAAASEPRAAELVKDLVERQLLTPIAEHLSADKPGLRASYMGASIVGLVTARYIVGIEPLASADPGQVRKTMAPVLQRLLTGPMPD